MSSALQCHKKENGMLVTIFSMGVKNPSFCQKSKLRINLTYHSTAFSAADCTKGILSKVFV